MFFSPNVHIPITNSLLSQTWVYQLIVQGILLGNKTYDSAPQNIPQTFSVLQALRACPEKKIQFYRSHNSSTWTASGCDSGVQQRIYPFIGEML